MKPQVAAVSIVGFVLVALSLRFVLTTAPSQDRGKSLSSPPAYVELGLSQLALRREANPPGGGGGRGGSGRPPAGGGCGSFRLTSLDLYPVLIKPASTVSLGGSFLVGVRVQVRDAMAERQKCIQRQTLAGTEIATDPTVEKVALRDFTENERKQLQRAPVEASLYLAGAEYAPKDPVGVSEEQPVYWSVRPAAKGDLKGWVRIEPRSWKLQGVPQQNEVQVSVSSDLERQGFSTEVSGPAPSIGYILSVLGSICGTLLASLPAWLAWRDKRVAEAAKEPKSRIIIP